LTHVGNDIVDLTDQYAREKADDPRFVNRVLTPDEQECLASSDTPNHLLWAFWSAKETAYKIISKSHPDVSSAPRRFDVTLEDTHNRITSGKVKTPYGVVHILVIFDNDYIHCVGVEDQHVTSKRIKHGMYFIGDKNCHNIKEQAKTESMMAREAAKNGIASYLMLSPEDIDIIRPKTSQRNTPPYVSINGKKIDIDISLSHDGKYVAYAFSVQ